MEKAASSWAASATASCMAAGDAQAASASGCGQLRYTKRGTTEMDNGSGWMDASRWPLRVVPRLRGCDSWGFPCCRVPSSS
jgi:hypothetical protein